MTPPSRVAFSVALTGNDLHLGDHQVVEYNHVYTNIGQAYDTRHGHFIVPTTGVYLLSFNVMKDFGTQNAWLQMVKNGQEISIVYAGNNNYMTNSQTTVEALNKGDVVWVRGGNHGVLNADGGRFNTFMGVLMFEN